jgi:nicotinamide riboside transporter PnuC
MKTLIWITFLIAFGLILSGLILEIEYSKKLVGFGVVFLFFVVFPLFSYYRWKDKDSKDYMLTKENLDKMRENQKRKKY